MKCWDKKKSKKKVIKEKRVLLKSHLTTLLERHWNKTGITGIKRLGRYRFSIFILLTGVCTTPVFCPTPVCPLPSWSTTQSSVSKTQLTSNPAQCVHCPSSWPATQLSVTTTQLSSGHTSTKPDPVRGPGCTIRVIHRAVTSESTL